MDIAVLGTGSVGTTLAAGFAAAGHDVHLGTRDPDSTLARPEPDLRAWLQQHQGVRLGTFAQAAGSSEVVVNATAGESSLQALQAAGADNLAGKVLIDVANPLDFSEGFPPRLFVQGTDSLGEQIQRAFPAARVVKTWNTMNAGLMLAPDRLDAPTAVFLSGDDMRAKEQVRDLQVSFGWRQIIDLGGIETARAAEMLLPMWLRLLGAVGSADFNWAIVGPRGSAPLGSQA